MAPAPSRETMLPWRDLGPKMRGRNKVVGITCVCELYTRLLQTIIHSAVCKDCNRDCEDGMRKIADVTTEDRASRNNRTRVSEDGTDADTNTELEQVFQCHLLDNILGEVYMSRLSSHDTQQFDAHRI